MIKIEYKNIIKAEFLSRPNRFIANCLVNGDNVVCHVKNTGRCKEVLINGATVYLEKSDNVNRKTLYDLVAVEKGNRLINIDSQIPNDAVEEFLPELFKDIVYYKREKVYKDSRFDFYIETQKEKIFLEVKGVTLENDGIVSFPDAPTERGIKHIHELVDCVQNGYSAYIFFVVQMSGVRYFTPNVKTHKEFADSLLYAKNNGVNVLVYDCCVTPSSMSINTSVEVKFDTKNQL